MARRTALDIPDAAAAHQLFGFSLSRILKPYSNSLKLLSSGMLLRTICSIFGRSLYTTWAAWGSGMTRREAQSGRR